LLTGSIGHSTHWRMAYAGMCLDTPPEGDVHEDGSDYKPYVLTWSLGPADP